MANSNSFVSSMSSLLNRKLRCLHHFLYMAVVRVYCDSSLHCMLYSATYSDIYIYSFSCLSHTIQFIYLFVGLFLSFSCSVFVLVLFNMFDDGRSIVINFFITKFFFFHSCRVVFISSSAFQMFKSYFIMNCFKYYLEFFYECH